MSVKKPESGQPEKKPAWWNPSQGSWQSPWSLREDLPASRRMNEAPPKFVFEPLVPPIPERKEPELQPFVQVISEPPEPKLPDSEVGRITTTDASPFAIVEAPSAFDQPLEDQSLEAKPTPPPAVSNHAFNEAPVFFFEESPPQKTEVTSPPDLPILPLPPEEPKIAGVAPLIVRRRVTPPRAQAPVASIDEKPVRTPVEPIPRVISVPSERQNRPLRPFHEPQSDYTPPRQVDEWPQRQNYAPQVNPWRRMISFSLLVFTFTVVAFLYWQDDAPPDEVMLQVDHSRDDGEAPSTIGRMKVLLSSIVPVREAALAVKPPWNWETRELSQMLDANVSARDNLKDLLEDADWHPRNVAWYLEDLGGHPMWVTIAILKQAEAAYLMRRGEEEAAFAAAIDLAALSRSLQELHAWPSYYDRSLFLHEKSCQTLADLLRTSNLDPARLGGFQEEFVRCAPVDDLLRAQISASYLFEKKILLGSQSGEKPDTLPGGLVLRHPGRLFFKPNRTMRLFESTFLELRDQVGRSPWSGSGHVRDRVGHGQQRIGLPNSSGENYYAQRIDPYLNLPSKQIIAHARHSVITTQFAVRRFMIRDKRVPPKLLNLLPDFLTELPVDPFSGEYLEYSDATGILSSVGTNFKRDDRKPSDPPLADATELAVEVGSPPPRQ
jgi:hypothetical protein